LHRVCHRLKVIEVGRGLALVLGFMALVLLVGISYDHVFTLTFWLRLAAYLELTFVAPIIGLFLVLLPALHRLSPLYVAGEIEKSGEGFHHTLVSYLAARRDPSVPEEVVAALAQRASEDVQGVALENVIDESPFFRANATLLGVLVLFLVFSVLTEKHIPTSMQRILHPFSEIPPPSRVHIYRVVPGSVELTRGDPLHITVRTGKRQPESVVASVSVSGNVWRSIDLVQSDDDASLWNGGIEAVDKDFVYRIVADDAQSLRYQVRTFPPPIIESMKLTCVYPEYMGIPSRTFVEGDIAAPIGTRVAFELASSNALERAWLEVGEKSHALQVSATDPAAASGEIRLTGDATYSVHLRDVRDAQNEPPVYRITARPDLMPEIVIEGSPSAQVVRELDPVELNILSSDDIELDFVKLYYRVNDGETIVRTHKARPGAKALDVVESLTLDQLLPKKGDALTFFAEAADGRRPEPNVARTETFVISYAGSATVGERSRAQEPDPKRAFEEATVDEGIAQEWTEPAETPDGREDGVERAGADDTTGADDGERAARDGRQVVQKIVEALRKLEQRRDSEGTFAEGGTPQIGEKRRRYAGEDADGSQTEVTGGEEKGGKESASESADRSTSGSSGGTSSQDDAGQGSAENGASSSASSSGQGDSKEGKGSGSSGSVPGEKSDSANAG